MLSHSYLVAILTVMCVIYKLDVLIHTTSIVTEEKPDNRNSYVIRFISLSNWNKIVFRQTNYIYPDCNEY